MAATDSTAPPELIICCPLAFEAKVLRRSGVEAEVVCCGPGARVAEVVRRRAEERRPMLLAGVAGALREGFASGTAYMIRSVRDEHGRQWTPAWPAEACDAPSAVIVASRSLVPTPEEKRALAERTGADLVDMESAAFAEAAAEAGIPWGIVRGVSDDSATALPAGIDRWVDAGGRTVPARLLGSIIRRPRLISDVLHLHRAGIAALHAVAAVLAKRRQLDAIDR